MKDLTQDIKKLEPNLLDFNQRYGFKSWPEVSYAYRTYYRKAWLMTDITKRMLENKTNLTESEIEDIMDEVSYLMKKEIDVLDSMDYIIKAIPEYVIDPIIEHARLSGQNDWFQVKKECKH